MQGISTLYLLSVFELLCEFHLFVFGLKCAVRFFAAENNKLKVMKKKFILTVAFLSISLFAQQMWAMPFVRCVTKRECENGCIFG